MSHIDKTISSYNNCAEKYAEKFMNFESYTKKLELFMKRFIKPGNRILDLGCGPGNNSALIIENYNSCAVTGMDLSDEMVKLAENHVPSGRFFRDDIRSFDLHETFDVVIASFCIVHLSDNEMNIFFENAGRHLAPGGSLYVSFMEGSKSGYETSSFSKGEIYYNYYNRDTVKQALEKNGITVIEESEDLYEEADGSLTTDIFLFARKE